MATAMMKLTTRKDRNDGRNVEVTLRWGGDVVEVRRLVDQTSFSVGRLPSDDLFVPLEHAPSARLLERDVESGTWRLVTAPGMRGTIRRGDQRVEVSPDVGATAIIDDATSAVLVAGHFTIEIKRSERSRAAVLAPIFDVLWANTATVSMFAMAAFVAVFTLMPRDMEREIDDLTTMPSRVSTIVMHIQKPAQQKAQQQQQQQQSASSETKVSTSSKAQSEQKTPQKAPASRPRPSDADVVNGKLAALFGGEHGFASLVGDTGSDKMANLIGSIEGKKTASNGSGGLGIRGAGPGGDSAGEGIIGIGKVGTRGKGSGDVATCGGPGGGCEGFLTAKTDYQIDLVQQPAQIVGSLDKDIIRRVVQSHVDQIRACYERALQRTPGLEAKIGMEWDIAPSGHVKVARVETGSGNKDLDGCVANHVRTWVFPEPKGGGDVVVHYPFVVKRSGG